MASDGAAGSFPDPRAEAREYLESKGVTALMQELGTALLYKKPENPREFLVEKLREMKTTSETKKLGSMVFSDVDVKTMFGMFDPTGSGSISAAQCRQAFSDLCLQAPDDVAESVSLEDFVSLVENSRKK